MAQGAQGTTDLLKKDFSMENAKDCMATETDSCSNSHETPVCVPSVDVEGSSCNESLPAKNIPAVNKGSKSRRTSRMFGLKKGQRYTEHHKQKVLNYAVSNSFRLAAKKFNVNANTLTEWAREYKRLLQLKKSTTSRRGAEPDSFRSPSNTYETDHRTKLSNSEKFINWLRRKRADGEQVWREDLLQMGHTLLPPNDKPDWFQAWIHRLGGTSHDTQNFDKHIFYPDRFKVEVVFYAKAYTKKTAADVFGISSRRIYDWCTPESENVTVTEMKLQVERQLKVWYEGKLAGGVKATGQEVMAQARILFASNGVENMKCSKGWLEKFQRRQNIKMLHINDERLLMWILARLDDNYSVSIADVTQIAHQYGIENNANFKGSKSWTLRFLKRHSQLLQFWNTQLELLPSPAVSLSRTFRRAMQDKIYAVGLLPECIGCMDEVAIHFRFPSEKVHTPVLLRQTSLKSAAAVMILSATSDGRLLPPAVVFKGSSSQQLIYEEKIAVLYQEEGIVDVAALSNWFSNIWMKYVKAPSVLVADSYEPHQSEVLRCKLSADNCSLTVIPSGCALLLQPCAFNLSQRVQDYIQDEWRDWCSKKTPNSIVDEVTILQWILKAYTAVNGDPTSIISCFQLSGLISKYSGQQLLLRDPPWLTLCHINRGFLKEIGKRMCR